MAQLTYYVAPWDRDDNDGPAWTPAPEDVHTLRYGYNLADLQRLTRFSMGRTFGGSLDYHTRHEVAWSAITEALYAADQPPEPGELIAAGQAAIAEHLRIDMRHHGRSLRYTSGQAPRFAAYWTGLGRGTPSPEERVVDATALWQIWPRLTDRQREALLALAAHDDYRAAAEALGVTPATFRVLVSKARRTFFALWHEGEQPSRVWGTDRRVGSYADPSEGGKRRPVTRVAARRTGRPVHELDHGAASTYSNHGCRCGPCTQAAAQKAQRGRRARGVQARRRITVSQLADIRRRQAAGEPLTVIARDLGFSDGYLSRLVRGILRPAPDPEAVAS
ncbi:hypothetical protein ABT340_39365 [Streptosporangium sp. NPDC000239]|uniref:RNA polymerase sigma factor n=1 Tax=Streptosporangium sp. NPDC000239 TaxID=3154248 RepID=UPI0033201E18